MKRKRWGGWGGGTDNNAKWEITEGCLLCEGAAACFQAHFRVFSPFSP